MAGSGNAKPQVGLGDEDLRRSEFFRLPWVSLDSIIPVVPWLSFLGTLGSRSDWYS